MRTGQYFGTQPTTPQGEAWVRLSSALKRKRGRPPVLQIASDPLTTRFRRGTAVAKPSQRDRCYCGSPFGQSCRVSSTYACTGRPVGSPQFDENNTRLPSGDGVGNGAES